MEDVKEMVEKMNILKPDLVLFTGDLISPDYKLKENDRENIIKNLNKLDPTIGKYAIYGDYDFDLNSYEDIMVSSGFKLLNNEYEEVGKPAAGACAAVRRFLCAGGRGGEGAECIYLLRLF